MQYKKYYCNLNIKLNHVTTEYYVTKLYYGINLFFMLLVMCILERNNKSILISQ